MRRAKERFHTGERQAKDCPGMATPTTSLLTSRDVVVSDYGSDIDAQSLAGSEYGDFDVEEERLIGDLLTRLAASAPTGIAAQHETHTAARPHSAAVSLPGRGDRSASVEVEYDGASRYIWTLPRAVSAPLSNGPSASPPDARHGQQQHRVEDGLDTRSPLERFRTKPRKPLSVTDLVSPAWCELQYLYTLSKYGRKPRTAAMKQGSKVHRVLEEQVHDIVPIQTESKEDRFGLRIWNTIQGLRSLRETGLTRELEVWGVMHGEVVNGIIDEISYNCPDTDFEAQLEKRRLKKVGGTLPIGQLSIEHSLTRGQRLPQHRAVYLADVKTRGVKSVPAGASLRPTSMQLMLYRKLLEALSSNTVDAETIFSRYNVEPLEPFTGAFVSAIEVLDGEDSAYKDHNPFSVLQASEIQAHNNLSALWSLMMSEFSLAIDTFSDVLRAEFRFASTGDLIGSEVFAFEPTVIEDYISSEMSWWKGGREAKGVEIEEAFKCRICDFATNCTWRTRRIEEATEKHRLRRARTAKSAV